MHPPQAQTVAPGELWQRHLLHTQAWIQSGFLDEERARAAVKALQDWLGTFPNQAADVMHLALSSAATALVAGRHERAGEFAAVVVDASAFAAPAGSDDYVTAALAVLIAEECRLETGHTAAAGASLKYARALVERIEETSALRAYAKAQFEIVAATGADALLERRQAAAHYAAARDTAEPLLRNLRRMRESARDWLRVMYGSAQELTGQEAAAEQFFQTLLRRYYVRAALGAARNVEPPAACEAAEAAAQAVIDFGLPPDCTAADLRGAVIGLSEERCLSVLDRLLAVFTGDDCKSQAATAVLLCLRSTSPSNPTPRADLERAGAAARSSRDAYAWVSLSASLVEHEARSKEPDDRKSADMFLAALGQVVRKVRGTLRHLPFLAQFDRTLGQVTADALRRYAEKPSMESSARLSACLEARRTPRADINGLFTERSRGPLEGARLAASDWLGRIARAVRLRQDALVLIPTSTGETTTLIAISDAVEILEAPVRLQAASAELWGAMARYFEPNGPAIDFEELGRRAYEMLPKRVRILLRQKSTLLIAPDSASAGSYELLRGPEGFLGLTHVIARMPSLCSVAAALEPEVMPAERLPRAVCAAAPTAIAEQPLLFADAEVDAARRALAKAGWDAPVLVEAQLSPELVFDGLASASLVHLAVHGEASAGAHAVLLTHHERVDTNDIAARRGRLAAAVYLSACSVGASEYLGGGVSRGLAHALAAKGAPAIVASQWPLEDATAKTFAAAFYRAAAKNVIGESVRAARLRTAKSASPALWASLVLIGNPWHRLGGSGAAEPDAVTALLSSVSNPSGDRKKKKDALRAASAELKGDPDHRRLQAAATWAAEFGAMLGGESAGLSAGRASELAALAHDLGAFGGEALCWTAAADLLRQEGQAEAARDALDYAIDAADAATRSDENWKNVLNRVLVEREKMDRDFDLPEFETSSGIKVNDRSDPAVNAILELQHALDQRETRRSGTLGLRLPEQSLGDLCWNAVVLGQRNRFSSEFACAGFCSLLAAHAVQGGWVRPENEAAARRVAGGSLRFLWSAQRMTHLDRELAVGQAGTLRVALEALDREDAAGDTQAVDAKRQIEQHADEFKALAGGPPTGRFTRARERLYRQAPASDAGRVARSIEAFIGEAAAGSPARAHRAAWGAGYLLELAYQMNLGENSAAAAGLLAALSDVERHAEGDLMAYLMNGFVGVRMAPLDPLLRWR